MAYWLKFAVLLFPLYCLLSTNLSWADAAEDGCYASALQWIELVGGKNHDVLKSHARSRCVFAKKWLARYDGQSDPAREKFCKDFILLWTHKECNYFRDDINPAAYEPCKVWSLEMHEQCLAYNDAWFEK